jgi:hypothetical protein
MTTYLKTNNPGLYSPSLSIRIFDTNTWSLTDKIHINNNNNDDNNNNKKSIYQTELFAGWVLALRSALDYSSETLLCLLFDSGDKFV